MSLSMALPPILQVRDKANPLATILSFAMALRYSLNCGNEADMIEVAVQDVLGNGIRTPDIMAEGCSEVGSDAMGDAVILSLNHQMKKAA